MEFQEVSSKIILITIGRKSGKNHIVQLRAVFHNGKIYFSRRDSNSDWLKNALHNPSVRVQYQGKQLAGIASLVSDQRMCDKISHLKYTDSRSEDPRIVLEVTPCE